MHDFVILTYSTRHSPELGYYYIQFKRGNTPAQRYCGICQRGFLTANAKDRHICGYHRKKLLTGRYKCKTCLYETALEKRIKKHFIFCKNRSSRSDAQLLYLVTLKSKKYVSNERL